MTIAHELCFLKLSKVPLIQVIKRLCSSFSACSLLTWQWTSVSFCVTLRLWTFRGCQERSLLSLFRKCWCSGEGVQQNNEKKTCHSRQYLKSKMKWFGSGVSTAAAEPQLLRVERLDSAAIFGPPIHVVSQREERPVQEVQDHEGEDTGRTYYVYL